MDQEKAILLAKEGHESAFRQIFHDYGKKIYTLAYQYTRSREDAEDIMQETFIRAFTNIKKLNYENRASFAAWLNRICTNCTLSHLRKNKNWRPSRTKSLSGLNPEPRVHSTSPEGYTEKQNRLEFIKEAIGKLSPRQRIMLDMRFFQGMKMHEIAEQLCCSESNVKTQIHRSMGRLRKHLHVIMGES